MIKLIFFSYVGNLDPSVTEEFIATLFGQIGVVTKTKVIFDVSWEKSEDGRYQPHLLLKNLSSNVGIYFFFLFFLMNALVIMGAYTHTGLVILLAFKVYTHIIIIIILFQGKVLRFCAFIFLNFTIL